jgi:hypothetical protein
VGPEILPSARRHGLADDEILHAYRNPIRVFEFDELTLLIGGDQTGQLLEIGVASSEQGDLIVHAMLARSKFQR